ncbi:unnamed protein product [Brachionus calyciflorus]|uniref:Ubiquitin-like protease family profile domain-containing protein n=1 Tax=Brachionus calyciflorus TaxID=104777 RepID=A0A813S4T2_9BILA|nr:unnamed protein product [Brachionus calyciflorus]
MPKNHSTNFRIESKQSEILKFISTINIDEKNKVITNTFLKPLDPPPKANTVPLERIELHSIDPLFRAAVIKSIESEQIVDAKNSKRIILLNLKYERGNDKNKIAEIFKLLKLGPPIKFKRLYRENQNDIPPIICDLINDNAVKLAMRNSSSLKNRSVYSEILIKPALSYVRRLIKKSTYLKIKPNCDHIQDSIKPNNKDIEPLNSLKNNTEPLHTNEFANKKTNTIVADNESNLTKHKPSISGTDLKYKIKNNELSELDKTIVVKINKVEISQSDLLRLQGNNKLNDNIIETYQYLLTKKMNTSYYAFPPSYYERFKNNRKKDAQPPKWVLKELQKADFFLIPFLLNDNHWSLVLIDAIKQKVSNLDSLYEPSQTTIDLIKNHFNNTLPKLKIMVKWSSENIKVPKQENLTDCGVYLCLYSRNLCLNKKKFEFNQTDIRTTETTLDLIIHNGDLIESTCVLDCPFSDHDFVTASLKLPSTKPCLLTVKSRNLSKLNVDSITRELLNVNFEFIKTLSTVEDMWLWLKTKILSIIDSIAPIKEYKIKISSKFPWYDDELLIVKLYRDMYYKRYKRIKLNEDHLSFKYWENEFNNINEIKLILINDFKNNKLFYDFYSSVVNFRSGKNETQDEFKIGDNILNDPKLIIQIGEQLEFSSFPPTPSMKY